MNFSIGLSGLQVAQRAIEIVGTNIANASTEGYHRQELILSSTALGQARDIPIGGAEVREYRRAADYLLESQIRDYHPQYEQIAQELTTLETLQGAFGTLDTGGLTSAMNKNPSGTSIRSISFSI